MYWQEDSNQEEFTVSEDVIDLVFSIDCRTLPVDHAWPLSQQIQEILPWFDQEQQAGLHLIHVADSGNGWERPRGEDEFLYPSRRTQLVLRLPQHRSEQAANALPGNSLDIAGHDLQIKSARQRLLSTNPTLYSRYIVCDPDGDEAEFTDWAVSELKVMGLRFKKVLSGMQFNFSTPDGPVTTRSLIVAPLAPEDSVLLQQQGVGPKRSMGFGLFIPQKSF